MTNILEKYKDSGIFSEVYEVVRTVIIVMDDETYRIEVQKCYSNPKVPYTARYWVQENVTVQPTYPQTGDKFDRKPEEMAVWIHYDLPWVAQNDPDIALSQALEFLAEGKRRKGKGD